MRTDKFNKGEDMKKLLSLLKMFMKFMYFKVFSRIKTQLQIPLSILIITLILGVSSNAWAIDEFLKAQPADTINPGTIGTVIRVNNEAIDRFFTYGRFDCKITYVAAAQVNVGSGSIVCSNAAGTVRKLRTNTSTVNCTWSDLDSGVEQSSTTYYLWAVGDTDATTFTIKISTSSTAPTGVTYYKRLGSFYNDASSNITQVTNDNDTSAPSYVKGQGNYYKIDSGTSAWTSANQQVAVSFSFTFAAAPVVVTSIKETGSQFNDHGVDMSILDTTTTGFTFYSTRSTSGDFKWIALGQVLAQ